MRYYGSGPRCFAWCALFVLASASAALAEPPTGGASQRSASDPRPTAARHVAWQPDDPFSPPTPALVEGEEMTAPQAHPDMHDGMEPNTPWIYDGPLPTESGVDQVLGPPTCDGCHHDDLWSGYDCCDDPGQCCSSCCPQDPWCGYCCGCESCDGCCSTTQGDTCCSTGCCSAGCSTTCCAAEAGDSCCSEGCSQQESLGEHCRGMFDDAFIFGDVVSFEGPVDLDGNQSNSGARLGGNVAMPLWGQKGFGVQAGFAAVSSNFHGSQYTGENARTQYFATAGAFWRSHPSTPKGIVLAAVFDWLKDDYYTTLNMSQARAQAGVRLGCFDEVGVWATIPLKGDDVVLGGSGNLPDSVNFFEPIFQSSLYWQHAWSGCTVTKAWVGLAEEPGQFVMGASARVPLNDSLALSGGFTYILPSASALGDQEVGNGGIDNGNWDEEVWNVMFGLEWYPAATARAIGRSRFSPVLPVADNGSFAVKRD